MWGRLSEVLKISVRTSVSCAAQSLRTRPGMLSGPAALRGLILGSSLRRLETECPVVGRSGQFLCRCVILHFKP